MRLKQIAGAAVVGLGLLGFGFWFGSASAAGTEPGSAADPLVSKSYVDQLVAKLADKAYVDQKTAGFADKAYVDQATSQLADKSYVSQAINGMATKSYVDMKLAEATAATAYQVVNVPKGAAIIGQSGTEIVLRGGKATAIVSAKGGVLDATGGADLYQGEAVKPNHMLVIPVSDGRGLLAQTDMILIVKGPYTINVAGQ